MNCELCGHDFTDNDHGHFGAAPPSPIGVPILDSFGNDTGRTAYLDTSTGVRPSERCWDCVICFPKQCQTTKLLTVKRLLAAKFLTKEGLGGVRD